MTDRLTHLLTEAEVALRSGRLAALPDLAAEIAAAAAAPEAATADGALRQRARRIAALLQATGRGLRAAIRRIEEVRSARTGLATYGAEGRRTALPDIRGQLTQRL